MAVMIYFDGLSGNASDKLYKHWTAARYVQFSPPRIAKSATEFVLTADLDATTNVLFQRANSGRSFPYVRVHWLDQNSAAWLKVHFDQVFVATVQLGSNYEGTPAISVELSADRWEYEK
jgi:type VI protein secretion system component Hcp